MVGAVNSSESNDEECRRETNAVTCAEYTSRTVFLFIRSDDCAERNVTVDNTKHWVQNSSTQFDGNVKLSLSSVSMSCPSDEVDALVLGRT